MQRGVSPVRAETCDRGRTSRLELYHMCGWTLHDWVMGLLKKKTPLRFLKYKNLKLSSANPESEPTA